ASGNYAPHLYTWVKTPEIDIGQYSDVHLQYRRWLTVQDARADQARITANDAKVWENYTDPTLGAASTIDHVDKEWRFHDVAVSAYFAGHKVGSGWTLN